MTYWYMDCAESGEIVFYRIDGGGHTWSKRTGGQYLPERWVRRVCRTIDAAEVIWSFFSQAGNTQEA